MKKSWRYLVCVSSLIGLMLLLAACTREEITETNQVEVNKANLAKGEMKKLALSAEEQPLLELFAGGFGGITFNFQEDIKEMTVYFDVYQKEQRLKHEEVGSLSFDGVMFSQGNLVWGALPTEIAAEKNSSLEKVVVAYQAEGSSICFEPLDLPKYPYTFATQTAIGETPLKIEAEQPVVLASWGIGESVRAFNEGAAYFKKENLENQATYLLYASFNETMD